MEKTSQKKEYFLAGIFKENPILVSLLGLCPIIPATTSIMNALTMSVAVLFVLFFSNIIISAIRKIVPNEIRIPIYIVIIASLVTCIDLLLQAYTPSLSESLGVFIPLITVNCIILGRAEAYASKNPVIPSIFDAIGMGLGFTVALFLIGAFREVIGAGQILGMQVMPASYKPASIMILAPGAFFTLGGLVTFLNYRKIKKAKKNNEQVIEMQAGGCGSCSGCGNGGCSTRK